MGANMKHYTEDGLYSGETHKMDDGSLHTGKTHTKNSKVVSHKKKGPFRLREVHYAGPLKCWKSHERKPGTTEGAKGSCQHKDPSKRPD